MATCFIRSNRVTELLGCACTQSMKSRVQLGVGGRRNSPALIYMDQYLEHRMPSQLHSLKDHRQVFFLLLKMYLPFLPINSHVYSCDM